MSSQKTLVFRVELFAIYVPTGIAPQTYQPDTTASAQLPGFRCLTVPLLALLNKCAPVFAFGFGLTLFFLLHLDFLDLLYKFIDNCFFFICFR